MRIFSRNKSHIRQEPSVKLCTKKLPFIIPQAGMSLYSEVHLSINICKSFSIPQKTYFSKPYRSTNFHQQCFFWVLKTVLLEDLLYLITSDTISRINIKRLQAKPLVQIDNLSKWHTPILLMAFKQYGHIKNDVYSFYIKPFIIGT